MERTNLTNFVDPLTFLQQLVQSLGKSDININLSVLKIAHSIFRKRRSRARSDAFRPIIKPVHRKFLVLYF